MTRYTVTLTGTADYTLTVDADTLDQAIHYATARPPALCHLCEAPPTGPRVALGDQWVVAMAYATDDPQTDLT